MTVTAIMWEVSNRSYPTVTVKANTRLEAIMAAASKWGIRWEKVTHTTSAKIVGKVVKEDGNESKSDNERRSRTGNPVQLGKDADVETSGVSNDVPHTERRKKVSNRSKKVSG